jgi:hypothetical protein
MPIDGIKISVFFTTHLTTDQPSVYNTLTNIAFAPIQQLIGQKNYQCLNGRVYELASKAQPPSSQLSSAWKVILVIAAIFSTPCGILTRYLSFSSPDITLGYWSALLLPMDVIRRSTFLKGVHSTLQIKIRQQLNALEKQKKLDQHILSAITVLEQLETQLFTSTTDFADTLKKWLDTASKKPDYPYPFQLAEKLKDNSLRDIPTPDLLKRFEDLHWNCSRKLTSNPFALEIKIRTEQIVTPLDAILNQNHRFFISLSNKMQNLDLTTEELADQLRQEQGLKTYSYPFYTQPFGLDALKKITHHPENLESFEKTYTDCIDMMRPNELLIPFINNESLGEHPTIVKFKLAIDQIANIFRIQTLYKNPRNN